MFDIDIPTLVVASVFMAAVSAIFFYYSLKNKKSRKEFLDKFNGFISELKLNPNIREDWRNRYILGMDEQSKTLVYCNFGEKGSKIAVSLPEVKKAAVTEDFQENGNIAGTKKILENLALRIEFKSPAKPAIQLPIYSAEDYSDLLGETVIASKWAQLINQQLTN